MKKYLVVRPKYGLCNQLYSISKGIIFGLICNRDVIFSNFQMDYRDENNLCNFEDVIDIEFLQKIILKYSKSIKIIVNNDIKDIPKIKTNKSEKISDIKNFITILFLEDNINQEYLDIDNPISAEIPFHLKELELFINISIKFTNKYIDLANNVKKCLNLNDYSCIHLRLENDSINHMTDMNNKLNFDDINEIYKNKYLSEIERLYSPDKKIFICTSLGIDDNINNNFYKTIKTKYNLIDKNNLIDIKNNTYREMFAIIDYIIAKDSVEFVGSDWSSFSLYINGYHIYNKKKTTLINIWKTIQN